MDNRIELFYNDSRSKRCIRSPTIFAANAFSCMHSFRRAGYFQGRGVLARAPVQSDPSTDPLAISRGTFGEQ